MKNIKIIPTHARRERNCCYCGNLISTGESCFYKHKSNKSSWICQECVSLFNNYEATVCKYNSAVSPSNGTTALLEALDIYETKLLERGIISEDECIVIFK